MSKAPLKSVPTELTDEQLLEMLGQRQHLKNSVKAVMNFKTAPANPSSHPAFNETARGLIRKWKADVVKATATIPGLEFSHVAYYANQKFYTSLKSKDAKGHNLTWRSGGYANKMPEWVKNGKESEDYTVTLLADLPD